MKGFIKNGYLFLIFFVLLFSKDYLLSFFVPFKEIKINEYTKSLEKEIENINLIQDHNLLNSFSYARVFYSNPYKNGQIVILINSNKIDIGDLVINNDGLVGLVSKVYKNYAFVNLLTNKDIILQVKVGKCYGILKYDGKMYVQNLNNYCEVEKGDSIYTSNLGGFNEEFIIGKVKDIQKKPNDLDNIYYVNPAVNFNDLNYFVIVSKEG